MIGPVSALARVSSRVFATSVDLRDHEALAVDLLNGHDNWRDRVIEEFVFESGGEVRTSSSYQVTLRRELLRPYIGTRPYDTATVVLPVATRDKRLLLNLDIRGPGGSSAALIPRSRGSALQASFLLTLLKASPSRSLLEPGLPGNLLEAICTHTPYRFLALREELGPRRRMEAISRYLQQGTAVVDRPSLVDVRRWMAMLEPVRAQLAAALGEPPEDTSSSENMLLALPNVDYDIDDIATIDQLVGAYRTSILAATRAADRPFLSALAEYGRRYEVLVEATVPLDRPFTIGLTEDRPLGRDRWGRVNFRFALRDARTGHLEARIADPTVRFRRRSVKIRDLNGDRVPDDTFEGVRRTDETLALYSSEPDRPYYVDVRLRLANRSLAIWATSGLTVLNLLAIAAVFWAPQDESYIDRLAVLAVPTTLAAVVVLSRDQTALAANLHRASRHLLALTILILWIVTFIELVSFDTPVPPSGAVETITTGTDR